MLLNIEIDSEFLILRSKLNQSFRAEEKKEYLKHFFRQLKVGILVLVIVSHFGTKFIKQLGASSFIILTLQLRHLYHLLDLSDFNPNT